MDTTERDAVQETINRVHEAIAKVDRLAHMRDNTSNSTITVTGATGWQVTSCLLLAVMGVMCGAFGLYIAAETRAEQRDTSAHLETIYMLVPSLREQVQANLNRKEPK